VSLNAHGPETRKEKESLHRRVVLTHLQTLERTGSAQRNICLPALKHLGEGDLNPAEAHTLGLVDGYSPGEVERYL
jgi:hypothetical protein